MDKEEREALKNADKVTLQQMTLLLTDFTLDNHELRLDTLILRRSTVTVDNLEAELILTIDGYLLAYLKKEGEELDLVGQKVHWKSFLKSLKITPMSNGCL